MPRFPNLAISVVTDRTNCFSKLPLAVHACVRGVIMIMTARPHPPGDTEVMRNNEYHWSGLTMVVDLRTRLYTVALCIILCPWQPSNRPT
jgi:hypothetical protein